MRVIHRVRKEGGRVTSFRSYCGGLPAPEANTNPLGYKFSWSPRGVLTAARNAAKYLEHGKVVEVPGPELFSRFHLLEVEGAGTFEAYPNRDSTSYQDVYGLEDARTVYRGTLRNLGHCDTWFRWARLGLFDLSERADLAGRTHAEVLRELAGGGRKALPAALAAKMGCAPGDPAVAKLEWLGVLSRKKVGPGVTTVLDLLAARMLEKMQYAPGERDMVVLVHKFVAEFPGGRREEITSSLVDFGIPGGDSSMARTVALPVALAVRLILDGKLAVRGVQIPVIPEIYEPVLDGLERLGIVCKESRRGL
jgi:saccharopine dehydrogenase-like NADP-dependent oxidoreductase